MHVQMRRVLRHVKKSTQEERASEPQEYGRQHYERHAEEELPLGALPGNLRVLRSASDSRSD
jgi:hypothetical protein